MRGGLHLAAAAALGLAGTEGAQAHRLDECLQAARVGLETNRVTVELVLTPGIETATAFLALIDLDQDGQLSAAESEAYADRVRAAIALRLDGRRLPLMVTDETMPSAEKIQAGVGCVRIQLSTKETNIGPGRHRVDVRNDHRPVTSVYLANALLPDTPHIEIVHQKRDRLQRELRVDFWVRRQETSNPTPP